jgi:hypothetical protein
MNDISKHELITLLKQNKGNIDNYTNWINCEEIKNSEENNFKIENNEDTVEIYDNNNVYLYFVIFY